MSRLHIHLSFTRLTTKKISHLYCHSSALCIFQTKFKSNQEMDRMKLKLTDTYFVEYKGNQNFN